LVQKQSKKNKNTIKYKKELSKNYPKIIVEISSELYVSIQDYNTCSWTNQCEGQDYESPNVQHGK